MNDALRAAKHHRTALRIALDDLELALAAPAMQLEWRPTVRKRVDDVRSALMHHIDEVESVEGLFAEINEAAPQLADRIDNLRREHDELAEQVDGFASAVSDSDLDAEELRETGLRLLGRFGRHRQHGADLVFSAYDVDIGGGD